MSAITIHNEALAVTPDQRDALLYECGDVVEFGTDKKDPDGVSARRMPVAVALADDLAAPNADGVYEISSVPRDVLIPWLTHTLVLALEAGTQGIFLQIWQACGMLLRDLGYDIAGAMFDPDRMICCCSDCKLQAGAVA
jgi:hypothetical protein